MAHSHNINNVLQVLYIDYRCKRTVEHTLILKLQY